MGLEKTLNRFARELRDLKTQQNRPGAERAVQKCFHAYDAAGGIDVSSGWTDISLDTEILADDYFAHTAGAAPVTIVNGGWYMVSYYVTTDILVYSNRADSESQLVKDAGGGFVPIGGTLGAIYNCLTAQGRGSASVTVVHYFAAGDSVKLQARRRSGPSTIQTVADACGLTIQFLKP